MSEIVFFDAAGTLFELSQSVGWHYAKAGEKFGLQMDPAALDKAFRVAWKRAPVPIILDGPREDDDRGWWRALVQDVFAQVQTPFQEEYFAQVFDYFMDDGIWRLYPETQGALDALAPQVRLGIISNFDKRLYRILENLGIRHFFDPIVISSEAGADKPHPQIFSRALTLAKATAPQAWHVGDDPEADWHGAKKSGLRVFELRRPDNSLLDFARQIRG